MLCSGNDFFSRSSVAFLPSQTTLVAALPNRPLTTNVWSTTEELVSPTVNNRKPWLLTGPINYLKRAHFDFVSFMVNRTTTSIIAN